MSSSNSDFDIYRNMSHWIEITGLETFKKYNQNAKRKIIQFDSLNDEDNITDQIIERIKKYIDISEFEIEIINKKTNTGYKHRYHIDGFYAREFKTGDKYQWVQTTKNPPVLSILYYMSDHNIDFKGGVLEFIDGLKIEPKKNLCVIFDSKTVHRVLEQTGINSRFEESHREFYLILLKNKLIDK